MRVVKVLSLAIIFLFYASFAFAQEPFKFNYRAIPFGGTIENVLKRVEGAEVADADQSTPRPLINVGACGLSTYFRDGLYTLGTGMEMFGLFFNSKVTKGFTVRFRGWENIREINLFFTKNPDSESSRLFFVRKGFEPPEGNIKNVFHGITDSISKEVGSTPKTYPFKCRDFQNIREGNYQPALVGVWLLNDKKIILLVKDVFGDAGQTEVIYVSNKEWQRYLNLCNASDKEKERKAKQSGEKAGKDF
jgi:hypothetical protein